MTFNDETVMAYLDGELDETTRAALEAALATDPGLAQRVARHRTLHARLHREFDPVLEEPIPERLLAAVRGTRAAPPSGNIIPLKRTPTAYWSWPQWGAMAASFVIGAVIATLLWRQPTAGSLDIRQGQILATGNLALALSEQLASQQAPDSAVRIGVSFVSRTGNYCRTFLLRDQNALAGLACRQHDHWRLEALASSGSSSASGDYRPAASSLPASIEQALDEMIAGDPLDASAEAAAREKGWQR